MFVELYRTKLSIEDGMLGAVKAVGIIPAGVIINVDSIISISTAVTEADGKLYHRVKFVPTAEAVESLEGKHYITDAAYERIAH